MPLTSDITVDMTKFQYAAVSEHTLNLNQRVSQTSKSLPKWFEVGAPKYREMRNKGNTLFPKPRPLPQALDVDIPSRQAGRNIPCRLIYPFERTSAAEQKQCRGSILHFHGGGWVLGDHTSTDKILQEYANAGDLAVISAGYRLAPESPYPAGPEDCIDVGEYLVGNSPREYGGPLRFIGGESAGGHLSLVVTFHLMKAQPTFKLSGLLLHYGCYDMTMLPSVRNHRENPILDHTLLKKFIQEFLPGFSMEDMKDPSISPLYMNLEPFRRNLPSAFFTCGTMDALLDDSIYMGIKWNTHGGEAITKLYPGAPHGFLTTPADELSEARKALEDTKTYIRDCMALV